MTLNITVLTPAAIYQSADFRVTREDGSVIEDESAKIVVLQYLSWSGFVTYAGLGQCSGKDVSEFIAEWLEGIYGPSMADVAACLEREGTNLLHGIRERSGKRFALTFTLAGFEDHIVRAFVISNIEDYYARPSTEIAERLTTASVPELRPGSPADVITTGSPEAVTAIDEKNLKKLATENPDDGGLIRRQIQTLNAKASASPASQNKVSEDCVVVSFRSDGYGILDPSGGQNARPADFPIILEGAWINNKIADAMSALGADISSTQMGPATFVSSNHLGPTSTVQSTCSFPVAGTESSNNYQIHEVSDSDFELWCAEDINEFDHVIGTGHVGKGKHWTTNGIPWLMKDGHVSKLDYEGSAWAINEDDQVAAMPQGRERPTAALYTDGSILVFPLYDANGLTVGNSSSATVINGDGVVAGSVSTLTGEPGDINTRAAVFRESQPAIVFTGPPEAQATRAVDINDRGQVLVLASFATFGVRSILWNFEENSWEYVGDNATDVTPVAITNEGLILGTLRGPQILALICEPAGNWEKLGTSVAWTGNDINDAGDVVGVVTQDRLNHPWLRLGTGEQFLLPYIDGHHTEPKAINNAGHIVGTAQSDYDGHAVIWRRG
jgi:hypothetical protein